MAIKIFDTWQENRPELDQVLKVTEWSANTTTAGLAFAGPIREVIERIVSKSEKNLSLEEVVAIAAPLAYLRSFDNWTKQNTILKEIFIAFSLAMAWESILTGVPYKHLGRPQMTGT